MIQQFIFVLWKKEGKADLDFDGGGVADFADAFFFKFFLGVLDFGLFFFAIVFYVLDASAKKRNKRVFR